MGTGLKGKQSTSPMVDAWSVKPCSGWVYLASWGMCDLFSVVVLWYRVSRHSPGHLVTPLKTLGRNVILTARSVFGEPLTSCPSRGLLFLLL